MASSLIRGKYVVVKVESRTEARVIADGAVFQRDGVVVEVGPYAELQARHRPDEVLGSASTWWCPASSTAITTSASRPCSSALRPCARALVREPHDRRDVRSYLDTLYFRLRDARVGHHHRPAPARLAYRTGGAGIGVAERILKAYEDVGMRVSYSYALRDQNRLAYEADEAFASASPLPRPMRWPPISRPGDSPRRSPRDLHRPLGEVRTEHTRSSPHPARPANLHWCSDQALEALRTGRPVPGGHAHAPGGDGLSKGVRAAAERRHRAPAPGQARAGGASSSPSATASGSTRRHRPGRRRRHHDLPQRELEPAARSGVGPLNHWAARESASPSAR